MEAITLKHLLAGSKVRLGMTSRTGYAGLANKVRRVQGFDGLIDEHFRPELAEATILVIGLTTVAGFSGEARETGRKYLEALLAAGLPCLALASLNVLPDFLVRIADRTSTFVFGSRLDDHLLTSRLEGLVREKIQKRLLIQGALVNVFGRGVLITGHSGAGKTTLALKLAERGHKWIADDAVAIEKRRGGRLYGRSHVLVKNLLEIKNIGVLSVKDLLSAASIADETSIDMVVQIEIGAESKQSGGRSYNTIMGVRIPLVKIPLSRSNDLDQQIEHAANIINRTG